MEPNLVYKEQLGKILDVKEKVTRRSTIKTYKIQWKNHTPKEATWETEHFLQSKYLEFWNKIQSL